MKQRNTASCIMLNAIITVLGCSAQKHCMYLKTSKARLKVIYAFGKRFYTNLIENTCLYLHFCSKNIPIHTIHCILNTSGN